MAAHGGVGRIVAAGAVRGRPTSGCTERVAAEFGRSAPPLNQRVGHEAVFPEAVIQT